MPKMTVDFDDKHMNVLIALAAEKGMSRNQLLKQTLRLYQTVDERAKKGNSWLLSTTAK